MGLPQLAIRNTPEMRMDRAQLYTARQSPQRHFTIDCCSDNGVTTDNYAARSDGIASTVLNNCIRPLCALRRRSLPREGHAIALVVLVWWDGLGRSWWLASFRIIKIIIVIVIEVIVIICGSASASLLRSNLIKRIFWTAESMAGDSHLSLLSGVLPSGVACPALFAGVPTLATVVSAAVPPSGADVVDAPASSV